MIRSGLILAGGAARRFGSSKPFAEFNGRPLVAHVADALASRCDEILVSIGLHQEAHAFEQLLPTAGLVRDRASDRGPIEGFLRGFTEARGEIVLVAPCDAPLLLPSLYGGLLGILGDHDAAVPRHAAMDPVRAVYRREPALRVLGNPGARSPSALVDRLHAVFLEGPALRAADPTGASFLDVNLREDLERVAARPSLEA